MKSGPRVAVAVGVGYLLGRTRKMRLALMIAVAGATGRLGEAPRQLLQQGYKRLAASPELGKITETVRGELVTAVKSAAMTAASSRIESLSGRIQQGVGVPGQRRRGEKPDEAEDDEDYADETDDRDETDEEAEYDDEEPDEEATPSGRSRAAKGGSARTGRSDRSPVRRVRR